MINFSSFFYVWIYLSCGSSLLLLTAERQDSDRDSTTTMDESRISSSEDATDEAGYFGASRNISSQKYSKMLRKTQNIHINVVNTTIIWIISIWISIFFHVVNTIIKNNQASPIESPEMDAIKPSTGESPLLCAWFIRENRIESWMIWGYPHFWNHWDRSEAYPIL